MNAPPNERSPKRALPQMNIWKKASRQWQFLHHKCKQNWPKKKLWLDRYVGKGFQRKKLAQLVISVRSTFKNDLHPPIGGPHPVLYFTTQTTKKYCTAMCYNSQYWRYWKILKSTKNIEKYWNAILTLYHFAWSLHGKSISDVGFANTLLYYISLLSGYRQIYNAMQWLGFCKLQPFSGLQSRLCMVTARWVNIRHGFCKLFTLCIFTDHFFGPLMYCTQDALIVFFFDGIFVCKVQFNTDNQLLAIKIWQKLAQDPCLVKGR